MVAQQYRERQNLRQDIAAGLSWDKLSPEDRKAMLDAAKNVRDSRLRLDVLKVLFSLSTDDWYKARVLVIAIQQPGFENKDILRMLATLYLLIARIEKKLTNYL